MLSSRAALWTVRGSCPSVFTRLLLREQLSKPPAPSPVKIQDRGAKGAASKNKKSEEVAESPSESVDLSQEDSEYPDWLWEIAEPVKSHKELPEDSEKYWRRLNKFNARNNNLIRKQSGL